MTLEDRLSEVHRALIEALDGLADAVRRHAPSAAGQWAAFAATLRGWLACERDTLLPLIDRHLAGRTDCARLHLEHAQLERLLGRAAEQLDAGQADPLLETLHALVLLLYRHGVRERRRFVNELDRILPARERRELLGKLPSPPRKRDAS